MIIWLKNQNKVRYQTFQLRSFGSDEGSEEEEESEEPEESEEEEEGEESDYGESGEDGEEPRRGGADMESDDGLGGDSG